MSRGKKRTRAEQRLRRQQSERKVAEKVDDLSCGYAAAEAFAAMCGVAYDDAGYNLDLGVAAEALWRRAARPDHALTTALIELRAELERQRAVMLAFEQRFLDLMADTHDHIKAEAEDVERVRTAVLGPSRSTQASASPPS